MRPPSRFSGHGRGQSRPSRHQKHQQHPQQSPHPVNINDPNNSFTTFSSFQKHHQPQQFRVQNPNSQFFGRPFTFQNYDFESHRRKFTYRNPNFAPLQQKNPVENPNPSSSSEPFSVQNPNPSFSGVQLPLENPNLSPSGEPLSLKNPNPSSSRDQLFVENPKPSTSQELPTSQNSKEQLPLQNPNSSSSSDQLFVENPKPLPSQEQTTVQNSKEQLPMQNPNPSSYPEQISSESPNLLPSQEQFSSQKQMSVQDPNPSTSQEKFSFKNPKSAFKKQFSNKNHYPSPNQEPFFFQNPYPLPSQGQFPFPFMHAAEEKWRDLVAAGESVSAWRVYQEALMIAGAQSWDTPVLDMKKVPSIRRIMTVERQINMFIHCFVGVRRITTIYDLEVAICQNKSIERFEQLGLGPLARHPLVLHYFKLPPDVRYVLKISSEDVILALEEFMECHHKVCVDEFLHFFAEKLSVTTKEMLCVHIRSLTMHTKFIREMKKNEVEALNNSLKLKGNKSSQCVESFSSLQKDFSGDHFGFRYVSISSEDDESDDNTDASKNDTGTGPGFSSQDVDASDRVDVGLAGQPSPASGSSRKKDGWSCKRKRKADDESCTLSELSKLLRGETDKHKFCASEIDNKGEITTENRKLSLTSKSIRKFIRTWKGVCKEHTVGEVFDRMLNHYKQKAYHKDPHKKEIEKIFSVNPFVGLLNAAVTSMKQGMWDSECDSTSLLECDTVSATVEEIIAGVGRYFELDHEQHFSDKFLLENKSHSLRKLCRCEFWLVDQFGVDDFASLGHGEFFVFLEKYSPLLPQKIQQIFGNSCKMYPLEVCMLEHQLVVLVSQAFHNCRENMTITEEMVSSLLVAQFPLISFKIMENCSFGNFLQTVEKYKNNVMSNCVVFSATLSRKHLVRDLSPQKKDSILETAVTRADGGQEMRTFRSVTSKDAIEVLLRAPMLADLNSWSHWDVKFAHSLGGSLLSWLLSEVNSKELLCLVTKDGRVIRIDQSATADSFLEAAVQMSAFHTAVNLLSVFSLSGGEDHVPLSLLKCYSRRAFEVILVKHSENIELPGNLNAHDIAISKSIPEKPSELRILNQVAVAGSRFVLDCLGYLPMEFHGFAADVLLSGMQLVIKDATSAILHECNDKERQMLHGIGLSLGMSEWIDDYNLFCSSCSGLLVSAGTSCLNLSRSSLKKEATYVQKAMDKVPSTNKEANRISKEFDSALVSVDETGSVCTGDPSIVDGKEDAALFIESIRRDEFGLGRDLSNTESSILKKQHARLGRALHCLSQELYSQDSHFLLELVQNADDNSYPENVEPTLSFILQESGIVVLNNEVGFSAENVKAICDVGNSTKKGYGAGYIGQKGIGFKSVFRVTNAPEIHSNGFHIKFDISQGHIGFVLPTVVPPCNIQLFSRLLSKEIDQIGDHCWNTCIILPFRSKLSEETAIGMFMNLHPSLLLFLHRLQCIVFQNVLNDSHTVMRKEVLEDGIVKVSCGKEKMMWLVASQKLKPHASHPRAQATEISIAFTLEDSDDGNYKPHLDLQPVFAFLPLRTYGLKFILQGDFVLTSSREEVDKNNYWNEWLLTKFPSLFVSAERAFCDLSCFRENLGKAITLYMSFVPFVGEVHGFFSGLPKAIVSELQRTSCLLLEGDSTKMVPPCDVLRGWNDDARKLMPDALLHEHLGLGFLDNNIALSDSLATALGITNYGPEILVKFMTHLCHTRNGVKKMGFKWLSSCLSALYTMLSHSFQTDLVNKLQSIPFVPLSDGSYSSLDVGTIWLQSDVLSTGVQGLEAFPNLYANLRIVNDALFSSLAVDVTSLDNVYKMLYNIGVEQLSAHQIIKVHILPAISNDRITDRHMNLMIDYVCFVMIHLQSTCFDCHVDRAYIISELQKKAYILTNHGFERAVERPIYFSKEFGNPVDINKLLGGLNMRYHELNAQYLKHPANKNLSSALPKWRQFFQEIGITDFVQVVQVDKSISDLSFLVLKNIKCEEGLISPGSAVKDWESNELADLLSILSTRGDVELCKYLLEVLDALWDDYYSNKVSGYCNSNSGGDCRPFRSSFMSSICDVKWIVSSMDNELHRASDLFYDCDSVRTLLGASAPYALPKVRSKKLSSDFGFKAKVTLVDALEILRVWTRLGAPFKANVAQMSRLYSFIWEETAASRSKILEVVNSLPFIFVPYKFSSRHEDLVSGVFLSTGEVYWHDPTGSAIQIYQTHAQCSSIFVTQQPLSKALCNLYPNLHDFLVNECGVLEMPSCIGYLNILQQLSNVALPSQVGGAVYQIFIKWADALKSGLLSPGDMLHLKECLTKLEYKVLPTMHDKWVSLHPSFGLVCWSDDTKLKMTFKNLNNIAFVYFGSLANNEDELAPKLNVLMRNLGVPAFSDIVTREAIYCNLADHRSKALLINWVLPYAQRYICSVHPDKYSQLKQAGFYRLQHLRVVVVEKLFYQNVIKHYRIASKKQHELSCLLQGNMLYAAVKSDSHALFLELSCLFFDGSPDLHLANFLHIITTMAESGSTEEQTEIFIVKSQKIPKLPDGENIWCLSPLALTNNDESRPLGSSADKQNVLKSKKKPDSTPNCPPANLSTAQDYANALANDVKTQQSSSHEMEIASNAVVVHTDMVVLDLPISETTGNQSVEVCNQFVNADTASDLVGLHLVSSGSDRISKRSMDNRTVEDCNQIVNMDTATDPVNSSLVSPGSDRNPKRICIRAKKLNTGTPPDPMQTMLIGKLGERVAYKHFCEKLGEEAVKWVNEVAESGLPYDIVIGAENGEFIEVKSTKLAGKDWFELSLRELQFGLEKGDAFSITHVSLSDDKSANITMFKNLAKQIQQGKLKLVVMMPKQKEAETVNVSSDLANMTPSNQ